MQALQAHSVGPRRRRWGKPAALALALVAVLAVVGGIVYARTRGGATGVVCTRGVSCSSHAKSPAVAASVGKLSVASTSPSAGATGVASNTSVAVTFTAAVKGGVSPTITPPVTGGWSRPHPDELLFSPTAPFLPYTKYTVSVPGGNGGVTSTDGAHLRSSTTVSFTIAPGSTKRLQELLAELGYLPLSYAGPTPVPQDMAMPQPGTLTWKWAGLPSALTGQWNAGVPSALTKGAVMTFETENGLAVDGIPGPVVWTALLHDAASDKANTQSLTYVLVTKNLSPSEHLTAWVNGSLAFHDVLVNTGVRGATTHNGTYEVFEHVRTSHMSGTDVTGTHYTIPTVPWVSYFNGGDALHYYPRAAYGFPQSNGCVEMQLATAQSLWPNTPIGTVVIVQGPTYGVTSSKNTTPATVG